MNLVLIVIIGLTAVISWQAWENPNLFNRYKFDMSAIVLGKQYDRLLTSGFLHSDTMHLFFNMFALYVFAPVVLSHFNSFTFVIIYLLSILGGSLSTILFHKKQRWYTAVGASGGVSGVVFSAIMIYPQMPLRLIFLPFFDFPGWVFGLIYLGYSMFGMKNLRDNIGHAAHLGGSVIGISTTLFLSPALLGEHTLYIVGMFIPIIIMGFTSFKNNH